MKTEAQKFLDNLMSIMEMLNDDKILSDAEWDKSFEALKIIQDSLETIN
jgi:hypothetical protein